MRRVPQAFVFLLLAVGFCLTCPAFGQSNNTDSHDVTIEVQRINKLSIGNDVGPVVVSALNQPESSGFDNEDFVDNTDGSSSTTTFEVRTNVVDPQKVTAEVTGGGAQNLGLQVSLTGLTGGDTKTGYQTILQPGAQKSKVVAKGIKHTITDGTLTYRATATPDYDPSSNEVVTVKYTLTGL